MKPIIKPDVLLDYIAINNTSNNLPRNDLFDCGYFWAMKDLQKLILTNRLTYIVDYSSDKPTITLVEGVSKSV